MKKLLAASLIAVALAAAACESTSPTGNKADPQITVQFFRLCTPFRGKLEVTIAEIGGQVGITVTGMTLRMKDINGVERFTRIMTSGDLVTALGTNHINPALSRILLQEGAYPGNVDTQDSKAVVEASIVDDEGNTFSRTVNVGFQRDGC